MGRGFLVLAAAFATLALAACGGGDSDSSTVAPTDARATPTPKMEPLPLPPQVRSAAGAVDWQGFLSGEVEFTFDSPDGAAFSVDCVSEAAQVSVGRAMIGADGSGTLSFRRDYLPQLGGPPEEMIEELRCAPDTGLEPVLFRYRVEAPAGLLKQLQLQPSISDDGLAFIAVHHPAGEGAPVLEARLSAAGEPGTMDCSATPAGSPTTYLSGDVKPFAAEDAVVQFQLPDIERSLREIAPDADIEFLCDLYRTGDTMPREARTLRLTPPLD